MGDRTILHSDMNSFYASVEMLHHPEFAGMPLAVGGDPEARHGIVLTANYMNYIMEKLYCKAKRCKDRNGIMAGKTDLSGNHFCATTDGLVFEIFTDGKRNLFGVYGQDRAIWD